MKAFNPEQHRRRFRSRCGKALPKGVQEDDGAHVVGTRALAALAFPNPLLS